MKISPNACPLYKLHMPEMTYYRGVSASVVHAKPDLVVHARKNSVIHADTDDYDGDGDDGDDDDTEVKPSNRCGR